MRFLLSVSVRLSVWYTIREDYIPPTAGASPTRSPSERTVSKFTTRLSTKAILTSSLLISADRSRCSKVWPLSSSYDVLSLKSHASGFTSLAKHYKSTFMIFSNSKNFILHYKNYTHLQICNIQSLGAK